MYDWTDNAPAEFKKIVEDAMAEGHHHNFATYYDFLRACVDFYEAFGEEIYETEQTEVKIASI